jgi:hypothetical protein
MWRPCPCQPSHTLANIPKGTVATLHKHASGSQDADDALGKCKADTDWHYLQLCTRITCEPCRSNRRSGRHSDHDSDGRAQFRPPDGRQDSDIGRWYRFAGGCYSPSFLRSLAWDKPPPWCAALADCSSSAARLLEPTGLLRCQSKASVPESILKRASVLAVEAHEEGGHHRQVWHTLWCVPAQNRQEDGRVAALQVLLPILWQGALPF